MSRICKHWRKEPNKVARLAQTIKQTITANDMSAIDALSACLGVIKALEDEDPGLRNVRVGALVALDNHVLPETKA